MTKVKNATLIAILVAMFSFAAGCAIAISAMYEFLTKHQ